MKIVFLDAQTMHFHELDIGQLITKGDFVYYPFTSLIDEADRIKDAEILIVNKHKVTRELLNKAPLLKYIIVSATGYNNLDLDALREYNIPASNVKTYSTHSVAQHVFSVLLSLINNSHYYVEAVKSGRWQNEENFCFYDHVIEDLAGKSFGILGFGNIGKKVSQIAKAFDMNVLVSSNFDIPSDYGFVKKVELKDLFTFSDILTLHAPLDPSRVSVINKDTLKMMKKNAILINTGRGGLINEDDLIQFLKQEPNFRCILDVLSIEPPRENELINLSNAYITPHIAWASKEARQKLIDKICENIDGYLTDNLLNVLP
jgi:glycerate dehydrogenase